ncbi:MAG: VOC family protein [Gammaproteobacteria bacterium]|jgi:predicted enzyme related to lactoylglutathione lyase
MNEETMKQQGVFSWNELMTTDLTSAKAFYGELLGWTLQDVKAGDMDYTIVKIGDQQVAGMMTVPPDMKNMPPAWGAYVTVDDIDACIARAESLGGKVCVAPQDVPDIGRFAIIADQQNAMLGLVTYYKKT